MYLLSTDQFRLLSRACKRIDARDPALQRKIGERPLTAARGVRREMTRFLQALFEDRETETKDAAAILQPHLAVLDLALMNACDIVLFASRSKHKRSRIFWPDRRGGMSPTPVLSALASNLAQTIQAVRALALGGYEGQGRVMVRYLVEIADLMLAVSAFEDVYEHYVKAYDDPKDSYKSWRVHYSPNVLRTRLSALDIEFALHEKTAVPAAEVRAETYQWMSMFAHANILGQALASHSISIDESTGGPIGFLGAVGLMTQASLARVLLYLWIFFMHLDEVLVSRHRWDRLRGANNRSWYFYRTRVFRELFEDNYDLLQRIASDSGAPGA